MDGKAKLDKPRQNWINPGNATLDWYSGGRMGQYNGLEHARMHARGVWCGACGWGLPMRACVRAGAACTHAPAPACAHAPAPRGAPRPGAWVVADAGMQALWL